MAYKTFAEQVLDHLQFLRDQGLAVEALEIGADFVRCHGLDDEGGDQRGRYCYKTQKNVMSKSGMTGLITWCRGPGGIETVHKTYGLDGEAGTVALAKPLVKKKDPPKSSLNDDIARKAQWLWNESKESGRADYLEAKGVGAYGIRFRETAQYGRAAVVPLVDGWLTLRNVQFLNPDGSKCFIKESTTTSLFHKLREPKNGQDIGIAESYVTAASCLELSGLPIVCAFSSGNLPAIGEIIRELYPQSRIIFFADNDRHLDENKGILFAEKAIEMLGSNSLLASPDFGDIPPGKDASDWNDLVRLRGLERAKAQMLNLIS